MPKRGENIYKRKDGRWEGRIKVPTDLSDERKYRSVYGKTYGEVKRKVSDAKRQLAPSEERCGMIMEEAVRIWYAGKAGCWKESTYAMYRQTVEKYILPCLGNRPLYQIDSRAMENLLMFMQKTNFPNELSKAYLSYVCNMVLRIMTYIKKKTGMSLEIPGNPIMPGKKLRVMPPEDSELSRLETYLLEHIDDDTCLGVLTALHTGLRIGELCALTWGDFDLEAGILHVRNNVQRVRDYSSHEEKTKLIFSSPKTACSVRDIPIPPALLNTLQSHRKQAAEPLMRGARGEWMEPRTLQYRFSRILQKCGIEHFRFHMLRHAFATRCVEKGFDSKSLSEILGHSNIQITLNLYVHSTLRQKRQLMNLLDTYSG